MWSAPIPARGTGRLHNLSDGSSAVIRYGTNPPPVDIDRMTLTRSPSTNHSGAQAFVVNGDSDGPSLNPADPEEPGGLAEPVPSPVPGRNAQQNGTGQAPRNVHSMRSLLRAKPMFAPSTVV